MNKLNKIITLVLVLALFFSCSKDEEKINILGVWKISKLEYNDCKNAGENKIITFDDGCTTVAFENYIWCLELRFDDKKVTFVETENFISTGEVDDHSQEDFYKLADNNTKFLICDDAALTACDEDDSIKIELSAKELKIHVPDGFGIQDDCYSILTYVR